MTGNNPKLDLVNVDVHTKFGQCLFFLKILSRNKILMSVKGHNSIKILQKMMRNNPKLNLVNVDVHTKFGQILSIRSRDIERKGNSDVSQGLLLHQNFEGPLLHQNFAKNDRQQSQA